MPMRKMTISAALVLVATGLCSSKSDARRTVSGGGVRVNGKRLDPATTALPDDAIVDGQFILLQKGKRQRHLLVIA